MRRFLFATFAVAFFASCASVDLPKVPYRACRHMRAPSGMQHDPGRVVAVHDSQGVLSYDFESSQWRRVIRVDGDCSCGTLSRICPVLGADPNAPFIRQETRS